MRGVSGHRPRPASYQGSASRRCGRARSTAEWCGIGPLSMSPPCGRDQWRGSLLAPVSCSRPRPGGFAPQGDDRYPGRGHRPAPTATRPVSSDGGRGRIAAVPPRDRNRWNPTNTSPWSTAPSAPGRSQPGDAMHEGLENVEHQRDHNQPWSSSAGTGDRRHPDMLYLPQRNRRRPGRRPVLPAWRPPRGPWWTSRHSRTSSRCHRRGAEPAVPYSPPSMVRGLAATQPRDPGGSLRRRRRRRSRQAGRPDAGGFDLQAELEEVIALERRRKEIDAEIKERRKSILARLESGAVVQPGRYRVERHGVQGVPSHPRQPRGPLRRRLRERAPRESPGQD